MEMDAEGEEENGEEEDTNLYCFCHKQSYGDVRLLLYLVVLETELTAFSRFFR
jgi:hypothetical protein